MPPAVKLAAAICARPALDPDIIAAEIDSLAPACSPFGLPVHVSRSKCHMYSSNHCNGRAHPIEYIHDDNCMGDNWTCWGRQD